MFVRPLGQNFPRYRQWHSEVIYASNNIKKKTLCHFQHNKADIWQWVNTEKNPYHKILKYVWVFYYLMNNYIFTMFII